MMYLRIYWENKDMQHQTCTRCIMDTSDPDITFDENGVCNHYITTIEKLRAPPCSLSKESKKQLLGDR